MKAYFAKLDAHKVIMALLCAAMALAGIYMGVNQIMKPDQPFATDVAVIMVSLVFICLAVFEFLDDIRSDQSL